MARTTFEDHVTVITADWLNGVDALVNGVFAGVTTTSGARTAISAAKSGVNSDITSITGLTTALPISEGGTGATTADGARTNLSSAESGANSDITSLSGLTTALTIAQGGTGKTTAADARTALSALGTAQSGFRNLIINGNFNVNQRGYVSGTATTAADQYTLDRWYIETSGDDVTFTASGNGNIVTIPSGTNWSQKIAAENILGGKYTLSWSGTATATVGSTAIANGDSVTLTANTQTTVTFTDGTLSQVQLEPGEVATMFEQRPLSAEFLLCRYYFYRLSASASAPLMNGSIFSSTDFRGILNYPRMRVAPTVTFAAASNYTVQTPSSDIVPSAISAFAGQTLTAAHITATISGATAGQAVTLITSAGTGTIDLDAELS